MKTMLSLFLVFCVGTVQAQKVIKLDPATVTYTSPKVLMSSNLENLQFEVKEDFYNEFMSDPVKFVENNFNYNSLGSSMKEYNFVVVKFINKKGYLKATYNHNGKLVGTTQHFKQVLIPKEVWKEIYKDHLGWTMLSNEYLAKGKGNKINKELYRIKFVYGDELKKIKFVPKPVTAGKIASN